MNGISVLLYKEKDQAGKKRRSIFQATPLLSYKHQWTLD